MWNTNQKTCLKEFLIRFLIKRELVKENNIECMMEMKKEYIEKHYI
jgi:hypothetical protein